MLEGETKAKLDRAMEEYIEDEVDRRMKHLSVHLVLDGEEIDADVCDIDGGEIYVEIHTPIYFPDTGREGHVTTVIPKRMAI